MTENTRKPARIWPWIVAILLAALLSPAAYLTVLAIAIIRFMHGFMNAADAGEGDKAFWTYVAVASGVGMWTFSLVAILHSGKDMFAGILG